MRHPLSLSTLFAGLLPLTFTACATPAADTETQAVQDGATITLDLGQRVRLADDSRLQYVRMVNDSRCPPGVQCVWAGDAVLAFQWTPASGAAEPFELHTGKEPRSHAAGARKVTLTEVTRDAAPQATVRIDAGGG